MSLCVLPQHHMMIQFWHFKQEQFMFPFYKPFMFFVSRTFQISASCLPHVYIGVGLFQIFRSQRQNLKQRTKNWKPDCMLLRHGSLTMLSSLPPMPSWLPSFSYREGLLDLQDQKGLKACLETQDQMDHQDLQDPQDLQAHQGLMVSAQLHKPVQRL